jgi:hypothetical protein
LKAEDENNRSIAEGDTLSLASLQVFVNSVAVKRLEEVDVDGLHGERKASSDPEWIKHCQDMQFRLSTLLED